MGILMRCPLLLREGDEMAASAKAAGRCERGEKMGLYVGISQETGELVIGDMLVEMTVVRSKIRESLAIYDLEDHQIHSVPACVDLFPECE